jgi:sugar lactone lactonase YvrE
LDEVIGLPTPRVTACTFGDPRLDQLFITTSALGLDDADPIPGAVFCAQPGTSGRPVLRFGG